MYRERRAGRPPRWVVSVSLPDGRRSKRRYATEAEALAALRRHDAAVAPASSMSLGAYLASWLETVRLTLAPATWRRYEQIVRLWLVPNLGKARLDRLSVAHVRVYLHGLRLHPQTMAHHRAVLRKALADAVTEGLLTRNVASLAKPPTVPTRERRWLDADDLRRLFEATEGTRTHALWVLAGTTGLRSAELLGLGWADVDMDGGLLTVRHTLHRERGEWLLRPTKTRAERTVPLTRYGVWALRQHRARQQQEAMAARGLGAVAGGLVFTTEHGHPLHGTNLSKRLSVDLRDAGLPVVTLHDLRHSAASWWLAEGVDIKTVSVLLGHSDPRITMALYLHVGEALKREAVEKMDRRLG